MQTRLGQNQKKPGNPEPKGGKTIWNSVFLASVCVEIRDRKRDYGCLGTTKPGVSAGNGIASARACKSAGRAWHMLRCPIQPRGLGKTGPGRLIIPQLNLSNFTYLSTAGNTLDLRGTMKGQNSGGLGNGLNLHRGMRPWPVRAGRRHELVACTHPTPYGSLPPDVWQGGGRSLAITAFARCSVVLPDP